MDLALGVGRLLLTGSPRWVLEGLLIEFLLRLHCGAALLLRAGLQLSIRRHIGRHFLRLQQYLLLFHHFGRSLRRLLGLLHHGLLRWLHLGLLLLNGSLLLV